MQINRLLLLDPPFFRFLGEDQLGVPLGLAYLAGALTAAGVEDVLVYNADFDPKKKGEVCNRGWYDEMTRFEAYLKAVTDPRHPLYEETLATIEAYRPDLVGVSVRTAKFYIARTIIDRLKERWPDLPIVIGGPHATANPEHMLSRSRADFVVRGEGEATMVDLVNRLMAGDDPGGAAGLSYRRNRSIVHNPDRPLVADLDLLPQPRRDLILNHHLMSPNDFSNLFSTRGCPFACAFCDARRTWTRKVRRRSPENIVAEIKAIKERHGSSFFSFQDDCLVTKTEHTLDLCREMDRQGLARLDKTEFRWWCEIHPSLVTEELIAAMKAANCVAVAIGAESGAQRTLDRINKASSPETIRRACRIIQEAGLSLSAFFMIGFPWETEADIEETLSLMEDLRPDNPTVSVLTPLPGTPIYDYCLDKGLVEYDEDFLTLFHQRNSHFYSEVISDEDSARIIKDALLRCENLAQSRRRENIETFVGQRVLPVLEMIAGIKAELVGRADKAPTAGTVGLKVDQSYTQEKIIVRVLAAQGADITADAYERLGQLLLTEFPQYCSVEFSEADGGAAKTLTVIPTALSAAGLTEAATQ